MHSCNYACGVWVLTILRDIKSLVLNYLIIEGYQSAAISFAKEANITPSVDLDSIDERIQIRNDILCGDIQSAIERINSLHPEVRIFYFTRLFPCCKDYISFMHHSQTFTSVMIHLTQKLQSSI